MGDCITIHANPGLRHQVEAARALKAGFQRHDVQATVTDDPDAGGDIHVCMGPWFALRQNVGRRVFYLDRAFWDDPQCVSLQWLDAEGHKQYQWGRDQPRHHPPLQENRYGLRAVVLCDYGTDGSDLQQRAATWFDVVTVRRHPSETPAAETLEACLAAHQVAIGRHSTAMVQAAISGCAVYCDSPHSPVAPIAMRDMGESRYVYRTQWINDLAWHNWALSEIESGDAWHNLQAYNS